MSERERSESAVSRRQSLEEDEMAEEMEAPRKLSRRDFVKGAATVAGVGALASCAPAATPAPADTPEPCPTCPPAEECPPCAVPGVPETWDKEADVVVVGFGGAGGMAAIHAHDAGAQVIILEKTPTPGGDTSLCGGYILAAGTSVQKAEGISDTPDEMYRYLMAAGKGLSDPDLCRVVADESAEIVEWLVDRGTVFGTLVYSGAEEEPYYADITPPKMRGHIADAIPLGSITWPWRPETLHTPPDSPPTGGTGLFKPLWDGVAERAIEVLLETRAMELVTDPIKKEVVGVKAESKGTTLYIKARRGVVLSTGSFGQDKEMVLHYCPNALLADYTNLSSTGDGHKMGMSVGAELRNMSFGSAWVGIGKVYGGPYVSIPRGSIMVSRGGRRFASETAYRSPAEVAGGYWTSPVLAIFDEDIAAEAEVSETIASEAKMVDAPTIGELAIKKGVDPTVLEDTLNEYNEYVNLGEDLEFGRSGMVPIKTPPFYAAECKVSTTSVSHGGLNTNTKSQVIDVFGKVKPRLYAAGRAACGVFGVMYPASGTSIADAFVFGRIAGQNAAAEQPWE
jgi:3-oxo-5alpha-steroid 4-dehydrogenase